MNVQICLNVALGIFVVTVIAWQLIFHHENFTNFERIGLGLIGGGMLLATPALWMPSTPFDAWSFNVARAGMVLFFWSMFVGGRTGFIRKRR